MNRLIRVTDALVAEILPDGSIRWWEEEEMPPEIEWTGLGPERERPVMWQLSKAKKSKSRGGWDEDDPGFENAVRAIEEG